MELLKPDLGLIFWTTLTVLVLLYLLKKFAWKPILQALDAREKKIEASLEEARKAEEQMEKLKSDHNRLLREAQEERTKMLNEAKATKEEVIKAAKEQAKKEYEKIVSGAREEINNEKAAAMAEVKETAVQLSLEIAEKILRQKLSNQKEQEALIESYLKEIKLS